MKIFSLEAGMKERRNKNSKEVRYLLKLNTIVRFKHPILKMLAYTSKWVLAGNCHNPMQLLNSATKIGPDRAR